MQSPESVEQPAEADAVGITTEKDTGSAGGKSPQTTSQRTSLRGYRNRGQRLRGSREADSQSTRPAAAVPTPLPRRPKGRMFLGLLLLGLCALIAHAIWDWQFRYQAHGVVRGRVLHVAPPWDGSISSLHVREGDRVRQGQLLFVCENIEHRQRLAEIADELKLAQAKLEAQVSQLKWQSQLRGDRNQKALSEYYELWGELLDQRSRLEQAEADVLRLETTQRKNSLAVRKKDLEHARFRASGQRAKVEKLAAALEQLKQRVDIYDQFQDDASAQIRPELLNIENLQQQLQRVRQRVQQGEVRSPVNGTVVKVYRFAGDFSEPSHTVMEIVEDSSLEPVLYVPQKRADELHVGDEITVQIAPGSQRVVCRVARLGDQMEFAPPNIARFYRKDEKLLPIFLEPSVDSGSDPRIYLGSEVKLAHRWLPLPRPPDCGSPPPHGPVLRQMPQNGSANRRRPIVDFTSIDRGQKREREL